MPAVLMVLTGANVWTMKNGFPHPCGFWAEEFVTPHQMFLAAGMDVAVATPGGVRPTVDPLSYSLAYNDNDQGTVDALRAYFARIDDVIDAPLRLEDVDPADYDVVFLVGGHGPMQDLAVHPTLGALLVAMLDDPTKTVAAVCHGPAGFLSAHRADGSWLFKDRELTGFSNEEETQATFAGNAPWLLEDRLRLAGARYIAGLPWMPHAVVDGNLVTGQQNKSAGVAAAAVLQRLHVAV